MTLLRILKKFCFGRAPRARITACMGRKCYLHGLLDDRTAILDAWHVLSCPVRHARALPACPELFASLFVCISFWVGSLRETLLRVLEVLGMSHVRSLKMLPGQHFGNFGAGPRQPMIFGLRGTRGPLVTLLLTFKIALRAAQNLKIAGSLRSPKKYNRKV